MVHGGLILIGSSRIRIFGLKSWKDSMMNCSIKRGISLYGLFGGGCLFATYVFVVPNPPTGASFPEPIESTGSGSERAGNGLKSPYVFSHGRYVEEERYRYGRSSFLIIPCRVVSARG